MKKLFVPIILFAVAAILLPSCSNTSKLAFNKRHYRSGSFVDLASKNHPAPTPSIAVEPIRQISPITIAKSETHFIANIPVIALKKGEGTQKYSTVPKRQVSDYRTTNSTAAGKNVFISNPWAVNADVQSPVLGNKQIFSEDNVAMQGDSSDAAGAALSLLWIVIVVILILWLIGILAGGFGLGGLINLLLVIALILLILWLLRIW